MEDLRIFTETSEKLGILVNEYKSVPDKIDKFLSTVERHLKDLVNRPTEVNIDLSSDISQFKSAVDRKYEPSPININKIGSIRTEIKGVRSKMDALLTRLSKAKNHSAFGGNYIRAIVIKPKVYSKDVNPDHYEKINNNIRNINRGLDWIEKVMLDMYNMIDQDLNILKIVDRVYAKNRIYESMELATEGTMEYFVEASRGKLKYDFRYGFDLNTGHKVKVVYSLDNINVTMGGHGYDIDGHDNSNANVAARSSKEVTSEIEKEIRKKGNVDHASKGQKILAIVDRKTGERLQKCRLIGIGTNNPIFGTTGSHNGIEINPKYLEDIRKDYSHIPEIHVGDIETESSFKTTHAFKERDLVKHETDWFGNDITTDSINQRLCAVETLRNGRGAKLNDIKPKYFGLGDPEYNHPSKKDIKKNPSLYTRESEYVDCYDDLLDLYEDASDLNYLLEKSHGKLKFDFRLGFDYNTGHAIKIVYSLDDATIDMAGGAYKDPKLGNKKSDENIKLRTSKEVLDQVKSTIAKKGDLDHASHGQKVLAIVDRLTGQRLKSARVIGLYNIGARSSFNRLELTRSDLMYFHRNFREKDFPMVEEGKIDNESSFKSTKLFKGRRYVNQEGDTIDNSADKLDNAYNLKYGRGAKMDDVKNIPSFFRNGGAPEYNHPSKKDIKHNPSAYKKESADNTPEYNVDMTETQAKRTLRTLSQDIINKSKDKNYKITQYTANIYANIITKNLLPKWSSGYKKFSITLDSYQSFFTFEFKIPTMSQDFISRFINGREPLNAFLHRVPEIKVKMSPRIFHTMQDPDDGYHFFKAAIKYYDQKVERYSKQLMSEVLKLNHSMKHLISTTNLSGIVTYPMQLLFVFGDVHMNNPKTFLLGDDDLKAVNSFIKSIYTKYAAPEKEKKKIIEDVKTLVKELRESCDQSDNISALLYFPEAVDSYLSGKYDSDIKHANDIFIDEQVDYEDMNNPVSYELKYVREKFGVKKLKRIPNDLVAYIQIETEAIETPNDKMMIASYCLSKIEIVEWYIELLEVGSEKYVVPHSLPHLQRVRTQLLECYKNIMAVKVSTKRNRPIIDVSYPNGYDG